jgi:hypothetical protein
MKKNRDQIDAENYTAKVIAEMSERTDKEIMEVAAEEHADPKAEAARLRALLLNAAIKHGKGRLDGARAKLAEEDAQQNAGGAVILSFEAKRAKFDRIVKSNPHLTLAARQGESIDETELDGYLADIEELGITDPDD